MGALLRFRLRLFDSLWRLDYQAHRGQVARFEHRRDESSAARIETPAMIISAPKDPCCS